MLIDNFGRKINYLRISVTDRCNLRCVYCMPAWGISHKDHSEILSFEEIHRIVKVAANLGIEKVRITGGEPLVRKDLASLIEKLKNIGGIKELTLTTNGTYLKGQAKLLKSSGLDRINISLDSLIPERFRQITRGGEIQDVLDGIEVAFSSGFPSLKINVVLLKDFNTDEVADFARLTETKPIHVRFIEHMPTGLAYLNRGEPSFSCADAKKICASLGKIIPIDDGKTTTARRFKIKGFCGTIGFISPISEPFCISCNKLRLTSDGRLRSCLHSSKAVNLKAAIKNGASDEELATLINEAVYLKPRSHNLAEGPIGFEEAENFSMCQIGG